MSDDIALRVAAARVQTLGTRPYSGLCSTPDCRRKGRKRGLCEPCYTAWRATVGVEALRTSEFIECFVDGCERRRRCLGLCGLHYGRLRASGDVGADRPALETGHGRSLIERLLSRVVIDPCGCWRYPRGRKGDGYAIIGVDGGHLYVHRVAYEFWIGPIPEGYTIDHVRDRGCLHKDCCNPDHLEAVTQKVNSQRGAIVKRERFLAKLAASSRGTGGHRRPEKTAST